jgi:hypothetical protein
LETFISHQRIPQVVAPYLDYTHRGFRDNLNTTIAYLALPNVLENESFGEHECTEYEGELFQLSSVMSAPIDPTTLSLSKEQKGRFERAMRQLDLNVFVHVLLVPSFSKTTEAGLQEKSRNRLRIFNKDFRKLSTSERDCEKDRVELLRLGNVHTCNFLCQGLTIGSAAEEGEWPKLLSVMKTDVT